MLAVMRHKRTIVPGTPFSPEAPASPCKQIQQESAARQSHWNGCQPSNWNFGSIYDEILSILPWGQQVRCLPWLHPDRWNPVNKINQHPRVSHRSIQHHSSWKCRFFFLGQQTHSVSLDAGESRGSGESTSSLEKEDENKISTSCVISDLWTCLMFVLVFYNWAGSISTHLRSSSSTLTGATSFAGLTLLKTHREEVSLCSSPLTDSHRLIYDFYQKGNND